MAKAATKQAKVQEQRTEAPAQDNTPAALSLDGTTRGKFVLFTIPAADRVDDGPVMRGFIETDAGKVNVAGWKKTGRESGTDYLSLKVGNTKQRAADAPQDQPDEWVIGPYYGRLFRETVKDGERVKVRRYFGFVEDSVRVGEDPTTHKGVYRTNWQIQVKAKPDLSNDQRTHYVNGSVHPRAAHAEAGVEDDPLPF
jgi:hypothetical protein